MISKHFQTLLLVPLFAMMSSTTFAHTGVGTVHGFADGFGHPWLGADHLLAIMAVGLWAAKAGGRSLWLMPVTFIFAMAVGALLNLAGLSFIAAEYWVAFSVLLLGLILTFKHNIALPAATALVTVFALGHGFVHAVEMGPNDDALTYAYGFLIATACLHGLGLLAGLSRQSVLAKLRIVFAWVCALTGVLLMAGI